MLFVVTLISLLVHIYSTAYMHDDVRYTYYYADAAACSPRRCSRSSSPTTRCSCSSAGSCVGLCSFMLIGHWWEEKANSDAALKAFLTTRTGDIGLMIGIIITVLRRRHASTSAASTRTRSSPGADHALLLVGAVLPVHRHHRQERPVPAAHLAARRHGRPHAGVGAHPRRHHGRRRRLPRRPPLPGVLQRASRSATAASTSWR